jgi:cytochrome c553
MSRSIPSAMRGIVGGMLLGAVCVVGAAGLLPTGTIAAHVATRRATVSDTIVPAWLYPSMPAPAPNTPPVVFNSVKPLHLPRVRVAFAESQLHSLFFAPDWDPGAHAAMPAVVARGRQPTVFACAYCHMPDGAGRPENASLAGLPAAYIVQQVADMKAHARTTAFTGGAWVPYDNMRKVAENATDEEVRVAAEYFAQLAPRQRTRIAEVRMIPVVKPVTGIYALAGGGMQPLNGRLIEVPLDIERHDHRDPYLGYVAYVPVGSIARGRAVSMKPMNDAKQVCGSCHGPALRGAGVIPPLAGRSPGYLVRQLLAFKTGARATPSSAPMHVVANALSLDEMIAVAAYAATIKP